MPAFSGKQHDFETIMNKTDELRTSPVARLVTPEQLARQYPVSEDISANILATRQRISQILQHPTPRLLVVIGPCSLHDPQSAFDYAQRLNLLRERYQGPLEIVMRTYFEKPRTVTGWKGLINDPWLDGSCHINEGLAIARKLLLDINALGMPTATEFLDRVTGQFIADLISWGLSAHEPQKVRSTGKWLRRFPVLSALRTAPTAIFVLLSMRSVPHGRVTGFSPPINRDK